MKWYLPVLALLLLFFTAPAQNLILNHSCDKPLVSGNIPDWVEVAGTDWGQRQASPAPFAGANYFFPASAATAELGQDISLAAYASGIDSGIMKFHFTGYVLSFSQNPPDESNILIRFYDQANTLLTTYTFGPYKQDTGWLKVDSLLASPVTARKVNVLLRSIRKNGSNNDGYYDELSLLPIRECPVKTFVVTPDTASICNGGQVELCGPTGFKAYMWGAVDTGMCLQVSATGSYQLAALDVNDCPIISNVVQVAQLVLPPVGLTVSVDTICSGDSSQVCLPSGYTSYQWNGGGTGSCIQAKAAGNYYATVTDSNGCIIESERAAVAVRPVSAVSIVAKGDTLSSFNASGYQWYFNNVAINGAVSQTHIAAQSGDYSVEITDENGCTAISTPVSVTITSLEQPASAGVTVYPNPSYGNIQVQVTAEWLGSRMEIYDMQGKLVSAPVIQNLVSELDLPAAGVYFMHLVSAESIKVHRLLRL